MLELKHEPVTITTGAATRLFVGGRETTLSSRKSLAMLVYIALQPERLDSRERIAARLWSESGPEQARAALRQTLRRLMQDLGPTGGLVEADRSSIRLTRPIVLDIVEAQAEVEQGHAPRLLADPSTDLSRVFADFEDIDPEFNLWIAVQRERLVAQLISRIETALGSIRDESRQLALAEALTRVDPTHEGACRAAMRTHMALGDTAQAMRCYEKLWQALEDDLDVEPSEKTQTLYVAIKQGQLRPAAGREPVEPEAPGDFLAPIAIIVEPTHGQPLPQSFAYFGDVFRDEMIAALSRFRDWLIVDGEHGSATPATYRTYTLRITLHGRDDSVIVSMRLDDQADGHCTWAERHTVTLDGMAALHRTVLRHLAVALNVHLSAPRLQTARGGGSPMGRRYELWMQAQALGGEWKAESDARAERILRELIAATPSFGPAMVVLAQIINSRPILYPGERREPARQEESLLLTSQALALDPLDSRTHLCRSWSHAISGSHMAALSHLDLALDLNENDPWTIISAALGFAFAGELVRARDLVAQAQAFGMRYSRAAQGYIATATYLTGDYRASVAAAEVAGDAIINLPGWQAAALIQLGDEAGAARAMSTFLGLATALWTGAKRPRDGEIIDWFMGCFPIQSDAVRAELRAALRAALDAKRGRLG